jgi:hypothetical protein
MKRLSRSHQEETIPEILEWYELQRELIALEKRRVMNSLLQGPPLSEPLYVGMTEDDVNDFFEKQRETLDDYTKLGLMSATEAAIRIDFADRVENRWKDALSRRFRDVRKEYGNRASLEEQILDVWVSFEAGTKTAINELRQALPLRHWLAHGRYWTLKSGGRYKVGNVYDICEQTLRDMKLM